MIIDINILKRLGDRFGVVPLSFAPKPLQAALLKPEIVFVKASAGIEPAFTGGGYQWDDELNGYRFGTNQKLFLAPNGTTIWIFKDVLFRGLSLDSVQKWTAADAEYPMGKANAFFIVYGKLTGQNLGEGETAGNEVADGETEPEEGGGLATADNENAPPYSKKDIQQMLKGEFPVDAPSAGPKASMNTAIPDEPPSPVSGPPPDRTKVGQPLPPETGSEAEKIIKTLYKRAKINPSVKLSKQNPLRLDGDEIIDLYQRTKKMAPEEGEKLIAFLKSGAVLPLEEGKIANYQFQNLMEAIVSGIVGEVEKAKQKTAAKKKVSTPTPKPVSEPSEPEEPSHSQMDWEPSGDKPQGQYNRMGGDRKYEQWLVDLSNKMWKDSEDIGHSHQGWQVKRVVPHGEGTTTYLLTLRKEYHKSRIFLNRNGKWFWTDPINRHSGWQEVEGPSMEPSIEQEGKQKKSWTVPFKGRAELDEMTTTSGGGGSSAGTPGYQVPGAFGKKMDNRKGHIEVLGYKMTALGEKEYNTPADKLYESIKANIYRMMYEDIVHKPEGGKCPYCRRNIWSKNAMICSTCKKHLPKKPKHKPRDKNMGIAPLQQEGKRTCPHCNLMAVNGIWTHEQGCPSSKKHVKEASGLGANFDRAQSQHDAQMPDEDEVMINCEKCGGGEAARITKKGSKGSSWWWEAVCTKCGEKFGNDNF